MTRGASEDSAPGAGTATVAKERSGSRSRKPRRAVRK